MRGAANIAMMVGGAAVGAVVANRVVANSEQGSSSKAWMIGGGIGAGVVGTAAAKLAFSSPAYHAGSPALRGVNLLGVGMLGAGVGAAIAGAITGQKAPVFTPLPTPAEPTPPTTTTPEGPAAPAAGDATATVANLAKDEWISANLKPAEQSLLAAGASSIGIDAAAASRVLQDLSADEWVGPNYSAMERVGLAIAGLEAGRTGEQVATTQVNVDGALDTAGQPATGDLESTADRSMLAQAAIRGAVDGETAAFVYAGIRNHDVDGIDPHQAARLAAAALEGGASLDEATAAIDEVSAHGATRSLPKHDQVTIASGAVRGGTTGTQAAKDYAVVAGDEWIGELLGAGDMTTDQAARLSAAATSRQLSGDDAALTFVNAASDDVVWDNAEDYEQIVDLSIGALEGLHTGEEAAAAFRAVSASGASTAALPAGTRFELAAAALAGDGAKGVVDAFGRATADQTVTDVRHDALLSTGRGFDATSDSELLDWYRSAG